VLFVGDRHLESVLPLAAEIAAKERRQAQLVRDGRSLREQFRLKEYVSRRDADGRYTFRQHLRTIGGAIEE
jgi:hypothetical protein